MSAIEKPTKYVRLLVCGGRTYSDYKTVEAQLDSIVMEAKRFYGDNGTDVCVVFACGAAHGADFLAMQYCKKKHLSMNLFPANWKEHGRAAGPIRNKQMLDEFKPDMVIAFPGGNGTDHMVKIAKEAFIPVRQWKVSPTQAHNAGLERKNDIIS